MLGSLAAIVIGVAVASLIDTVAGQAAAYDQCGGTGYTGPTSCLPGFACTSQTEWYSQCVPSAAMPSSSKLPLNPTTTQPPFQSLSPGIKCAGAFTPISASAYVSALNPGWNLGNTLDAIPDETSWGNDKVTGQVFDDIKAQGFRSVRLPVTYAYHFIDGPENTGTSPEWIIQPAWLQRVSEVVDMIVSRGLYAIVNVHHDSWIWADITAATANISMIEEKFYRVWYQAGQQLACKSSLVAFESINEPPANTAEDGAQINRFNEIFLRAVNEAGGRNGGRVVNLVGGGQDSVKTSLWFKRPDARYKNPWAIQYHYYSPYDFIFSAWGKTIWGFDADKTVLETDIANIRNNFTDVPLLIGEWDASPVMTEPAARWKYWDFIVRTAAKYNTATVLWDNGNDNFDRRARVWRDKTAADVLVNAYKGVANSLPDSTTDAAAATQSSSAYVFHRVGDAVTDQALPFLLNGNTFKAVSNGVTALKSGTDYTISGSSLTFKASYLAPLLGTTAGVKTNLTVAFSAGASSTIQVVAWAPPTLPASTSKAVAGAELFVPVNFKGVHKPAAVRALKADGTYFVDDWTQYLGPLQQARTTFGSQCAWDWGREGVTLTQAAVDAVVTGGQAVTFMIEAYPRVEGNNANYTLTV